MPSPGQSLDVMCVYAAAPPHHMVNGAKAHTPKVGMGRLGPSRKTTGGVG